MDLKIYLGCLLVGLVFTLLGTLFGHFFGGGHDAPITGSGGHAEAGNDGSDSPGASAFSPTIITAFVTVFGGLGLICREIPALRPPPWSAAVALTGALAAAAILLGFLRFVFARTQGSSESKVSELVGSSATVISPIPDAGVGEIAYVAGGSRYTAPAREEAGRHLSAGQSVRIVRIIGSQFYVAPR